MAARTGPPALGKGMKTPSIYFFGLFINLILSLKVNHENFYAQQAGTESLKNRSKSLVP